MLKNKRLWIIYFVINFISEVKLFGSVINWLLVKTKVGMFMTLFPMGIFKEKNEQKFLFLPFL